MFLLCNKINPNAKNLAHIFDYTAHLVPTVLLFLKCIRAQAVGLAVASKQIRFRDTGCWFNAKVARKRARERLGAAKSVDLTGQQFVLVSVKETKRN